MRKITTEPGFEPRAAGREARTLPLSYAAPLLRSNLLEEGFRDELCDVIFAAAGPAVKAEHQSFPRSCSCEEKLTLTLPLTADITVQL